MLEALKGLILKTFGSRKASAVVMFFLVRLLTPALARVGVDPAPVIEALDSLVNVLMVWLFAQGAADTAKALPAPPANADGVPGESK